MPSEETIALATAFCKTTGRVELACKVARDGAHSFTVCPASDTPYSIRAEHGPDSMPDETWVKIRDMCAPAAPTSDPRRDNATKNAEVIPSVEVSMADIMAETPPPIAPPAAPMSSKRSKG